MNGTRPTENKFKIVHTGHFQTRYVMRVYLVVENLIKLKKTNGVSINTNRQVIKVFERRILARILKEVLKYGIKYSGRSG